MAEKIARTVGKILKEDGRDREKIAEKVSELLGEKVSRAMIDAYSSQARREHPIPAHRLLALLSVTGRWDCLDALLCEWGMRIATPEDVKLLILGNAVKARHSLDSFIRDALERGAE